MSKNNKNYSNYYNKPEVDTTEETVTAAPVEVEEVVPEAEEVVEVAVVEEPAPQVKYTINNCKKLNVRSKPNKNSSVVCVIDNTAELTIDDFETNSAWVKVCTNAGVTGYCMKEYIAVK